jgi:hypothetical protein
LAINIDPIRDVEVSPRQLHIHLQLLPGERDSDELPHDCRREASDKRRIRRGGFEDQVDIQ